MRLGKSDGRHPVAIDDEIARQFAAMGGTVNPAAIVTETSEMFEVWPCNWDAVTAFLAVETQWRVALGFGGMAWLGLDYGAADVVFRRRDLSDEAFASLQIMEREALAVFAEEAR